MTSLESGLSVELHPGKDRGQTELGWLHSKHSFSFGQYQDPRKMNFRSLRVINDDIVEPGAGFGEHGHRDMEILTWVLSGALKHGDSLGNMQVLKPGELQAMTAGTGIRHSEYNASVSEPVHFLQIWILPSQEGVQPRYLQKTFDEAGRRNQWQKLAVGPGHEDANALPIDQDAVVSMADLETQSTVTLKAKSGRHTYLHVATGHIVVPGQTLKAGDAFSLSESGEIELQAMAPSQVIWFDLA